MKKKAKNIGVRADVNNRNKWCAVPYYVWMIIFIVVPLVMVVFFSFTDSDYHFTTANYEKFLTRGANGELIYVTTLLRSLGLALIATLICLIVGYPVALILSSKRIKRSDLLITAIMLPTWMNFLLRTYAWMTIIGRNGLLDTLLALIGLGPVEMIGTNGAIILGMVYNFLPFMILPIYSVMAKMDHSLVEAATDLGANPLQVFLRVKLPLSMSGIATGITMVFMPAASSFVIPNLLGGNKVSMIGNTIEDQFKSAGNYNFGSTIAMILMVCILLSMLIFNGKGDKEEMIM